MSDMKTIIRSAHFYFWPVIIANGVAMTWAVGGDLLRGGVISTAIASLASFGFLLNDLWDREVDKVNEARHFENAGIATMRTGIAFCIAFLLGGLSCAYLLGTREFLVAGIIAAGLALYSLLLRRFLLIPTLLAAVLAATPLWVPLWLQSPNAPASSWVFVAVLTLIIAARETFMDARDRVGDAAGGRDTLATVFGARIAKMVGAILTIGAMSALVLIAAIKAAELQIVAQIGVLTLIALMLYLVAVPAVQVVVATDERAAIQRYVLRSRLGMAIVPLLIFAIWRF